MSKITGLMHRVYKIGQRHELVTRNPVQHVETRTKTDYCAIVITPAQTLTILESLGNPLHYALVLDLCRDCSPRVRDSLAALIGHPVGRGEDSGFKALGEGTGRRDKD